MMTAGYRVLQPGSLFQGRSSTNLMKQLRCMHELIIEGILMAQHKSFSVHNEKGHSSGYIYLLSKSRAIEPMLVHSERAAPYDEVLVNK